MKKDMINERIGLYNLAKKIKKIPERFQDFEGKVDLRFTKEVISRYDRSGKDL